MELSFRRLTPADLEVAHVLHGDPETNVFNPYGPDPDLATTRTRLEEWLRHWDEYGFGYELILDEDRDGEVVGICGVRRDVWQGLHVLNLYWRLLPSAWGRGYATAAGRHALDMARTARHREPVVARMLAGNAASARVAERVGLRRREDLDASVGGADWVVYADQT